MTDKRVVQALEKKSDMRSEFALVFAVWCVYAAAETLVLSAFAPEHWQATVSAQSLFDTGFQGVVAFIIAFPLADSQLVKQRYTAFATYALALLAISSFSLEFWIDPFLFGGMRIPVVGYTNFIEGAAVATLLAAVRLLVNRRRNERRVAELQRAKTEAELQYLKAQINPHVLFNALNNIYSHALHKSEQTPDLILKLADMLRYMIYDCADDDVSLDREVAFLSDYVDIQTLSLGERGSVSFQVDGIIEGKRIAPFLLIPFIENCFKHSSDTQADDICIDIDLEAEGERLYLSCSNTFDPAWQKQTASQNSGIGLTNVRRRLKLLFGNNFTLDAIPKDDEYRVKLSVPVLS